VNELFMAKLNHRLGLQSRTAGVEHRADRPLEDLIGTIVVTPGDF
jgi:hypothetical protein